MKLRDLIYQLQMVADTGDGDSDVAIRIDGLSLDVEGIAATPGTIFIAYEFPAAKTGTAADIAKETLLRLGLVGKIEAIKNVRAETGMGLKEAKDFVDDLLKQLVLHQ